MLGKRTSGEQENRIQICKGNQVKDWMIRCCRILYLLFFMLLVNGYNTVAQQDGSNTELDAKISRYWNSMERVLYAELPSDTSIAIDCHQLDSAIFYFYDYIKVAKNTLSPPAFKTKVVYYLLALQTRFRYIFLRNPDINYCYKAKNFMVLNIALKIDPDNIMIKNNQLLFESEIEKLEHNKTKETLKSFEQENIKQQQMLDMKAMLMNQQQAEIINQKDNLATLDSILSGQREELVVGEKKIQEQKKVLSQQLSQIQTQNLILILFIVVLVLVLSLVFFIYRNYRHNKKVAIELDQKNKKIESSLKIIESTNEKMTDSINYALLIQHSILPLKHAVDNAFPSSFILYKPKDIVAGDFYWFHETENRLFIAAADCTGHGVPGALMSIVCTEKLNEAITRTDDVSTILQTANIRLKKVMHQSDNKNSTRDGMDLALCSFNKDMTELEYSGANRPIWIIRKVDAPAEAQLEEIKATKRGIGGYTKDDQEFTKHSISLQKGDTIYLTSDGYADQFSPADNKIMSRNLKEMLVSIQEKSMEEQKKHLDTYVENWKGGLEQTDDILVIGIRI